MTSSNFDEINRMFEQMDRSVSGLRRRMREGFDATDGWRGSDLHKRLTETEDHYRFVADLPGFEREDIDLTVSDGVLALSASRDVAEDDVIRSRRVDDRVTLPADADGEAAAASYRNGVLEVEFPLAEGAAAGHRIDVE